MSLLVHHLVIAGHGQRRGQLHGCDCLLANLDDFRRPSVRIESLAWDADWQAEAAFIARHAGGDRPIVCLYPYSWGFGWGAIELAKALETQGLGVFGMRVCDGVYRHSYPWGNWRAFWPWSVVRLPASVAADNVELFVQQNTLLRGHPVIDAQGEPLEPHVITRVETTCIKGGQIWQPATHANMDEAREWIESSVELAGEVDRMVDELEATMY